MTSFKVDYLITENARPCYLTIAVYYLLFQVKFYDLSSE